MYINSQETTTTNANDSSSSSSSAEPSTVQIVSDAEVHEQDKEKIKSSNKR